jgi:hypothetical protein
MEGDFSITTVEKRDSYLSCVKGSWHDADSNEKIGNEKERKEGEDIVQNHCG